MKTKMTIYFDFDGTLIDISKKMYEAYADFLQDHSKDYLTYQTFWDLKRTGMSTEEILKQTKAETTLQDYLKEMPIILEKDIYLGLDFCFEGVFETLKALKKNHFQIGLVSKRQNKANLEMELSNLALKPLIDKIIIGDREATLKKIITPKDVFVSDSVSDIKMGKRLKMKTVAITTGLSSRTMLQEAEPDLLIDNLKQIYEVFRPKDREPISASEDSQNNPESNKKK